MLSDNKQPDGANSHSGDYHIWYDKIESSYPGVANLTSVDFFGLPLNITTYKSTVKQDNLAFYISATDMIQQLSDISGGAAVVHNKAGTSIVRGLSPRSIGSDYASLQDYVDQLAAKYTGDSSFSIHGFFYGSPAGSYS